jgi:SAM-dependent methyltransferase
MKTTRPLWPRVRRRLKNLLYVPIDVIDGATGNRPPGKMIFVGDGSWRAVGNEFLHHFRSLAGLQPHEAVLDVGCGIGRMALPLTRYLNAKARYVGFDIVPSGIAWCTTRISERFPNFIFHHADIYNSHYNPSGKLKATEYRFPAEDGSMDFVFLTSVFTHMLDEDMGHYMDEIRRVLKPDGRVFLTLFLMNMDSQARVEKGEAVFSFKKYTNNAFVVDDKDPEAAIAFDQEYIRKCLRQRRLIVGEPIHLGTWAGRTSGVSFQDILVARRI